MLKPGETVDSWCGKCKLIVAHTIEAMAGKKPARVKCNTCKAKHVYKPEAPGAGSRQARKTKGSSSLEPQPRRARASRYQTLLKGKDMAVAKSYSSKNKYSLGDVMQHPSFGFGVATAVKDATKVEVLFEGGSKLLIQGR